MVATFNGLLFVLLAALYIAKSVAFKHPSNPTPPPGPKGLPLLGAVLSIDSSQPWFTYFQWRKSFGDIVYTRFFNMNILVINSAKVARDLFELRSRIYSDRPKFVTAEPYGIADGTVFMPYGDTWRLHRRIYHQTFNLEAIPRYRPLQCEKARQLIINLTEDPLRFSVHLHTYSTGIIMSIVSGYDTAPTNDPYVEYAEQGMTAIMKAVDQNRAALLEMFPFLLRLPTWIPGSFKAEAAKAKSYSTRFRKLLFGMALEQMASGISAPSMIGGAIKRNESNGNSPEVTVAIRSTSSAAYGAASETTSASLDVFVLAMVLFPEVQKRAQDDIEAVVGTDRLPGFSDRPSLPFVEAILRETLRWHPVAPLGFPHATATEDVYEGSYIPKGTTVMVNTWGLAHDEETYPKPFDFNPKRFLREDGTLTGDDCSFTFGLGRRTCPGRHVANASMWIAIASMLATFDFMKACDDQGNEIDFSPEFIPNGTSRPKPFPCRIVARKPESAIRELAMQEL